MSVLIKGMDTPKCCGACDLVEYDPMCINEWWCPMALNNVKDYISDDSCRPTFCPLVEIPPHGDLIDRTALKTKLNNVHDFLLGDCKFSELATSDKARIDELTNCIAEVVNAPTVIESEEE